MALTMPAPEVSAGDLCFVAEGLGQVAAATELGLGVATDARLGNRALHVGAN